MLIGLAVCVALSGCVPILPNVNVQYEKSVSVGSNRSMAFVPQILGSAFHAGPTVLAGLLGALVPLKAALVSGLQAALQYNPRPLLPLHLPTLVYPAHVAYGPPGAMYALPTTATTSALSSTTTPAPAKEENSDTSTGGGENDVLSLRFGQQPQQEAVQSTRLPKTTVTPAPTTAAQASATTALRTAVTFTGGLGGGPPGLNLIRPRPQIRVIPDQDHRSSNESTADNEIIQPANRAKRNVRVHGGYSKVTTISAFTLSSNLGVK